MELHHKLRGMFQSLAVEQSKKFQQAVHSALNKLICNYGSHAKVGVYSLIWEEGGRGEGVVAREYLKRGIHKRMCQLFP